MKLILPYGKPGTSSCLHRLIRYLRMVSTFFAWRIRQLHLHSRVSRKTTSSERTPTTPLEIIWTCSKQFFGESAEQSGILRCCRTTVFGKSSGGKLSRPSATVGNWRGEPWSEQFPAFLTHELVNQQSVFSENQWGSIIYTARLIDVITNAFCGIKIKNICYKPQPGTEINNTGRLLRHQF